MQQIVIDIETAEDSNVRQEIADRIIGEKRDKRLTDLSKVQANIESIRGKFPLYWYSGQIVAIGVSDSDVDIVFYQNENMDEKDVLVAFWGWCALRTPFYIVSYNGKNFDIPYINFRSCLNGIKPTCHLPMKRYDTNHHIDLYEDVFRENSLDFWCDVFGINVPDSNPGSVVPELFKQKEYEKIKQHSHADIRKIRQLFDKIKDYI